MNPYREEISASVDIGRKPLSNTATSFQGHGHGRDHQGLLSGAYCEVSPRSHRSRVLHELHSHNRSRTRAVITD